MEFLASVLAGVLTILSGMGISGPLSSPTEPVVVLPTDTSGEPLRIPIFIYHTVAPHDPEIKDEFAIEPSLLKEHLEYLNESGYTTVTMKEVADMLRRGTTTPFVKPVALTFDDGWVTQYKNAYPLLKEYGAKATFYVFPNPIGKDDRFMTWEQLEELRDGGIEIASHSFTHPLMSKQTPEMLHHEMNDSKVILEEKLGITVTNFASPFGYTSDAVVAELKRDGYETGRTTNPGFTHTASSASALDAYLVHQGISDFVWALEHGE